MELRIFKIICAGLPHGSASLDSVRSHIMMSSRRMRKCVIQEIYGNLPKGIEHSVSQLSCDLIDLIWPHATLYYTIDTTTRVG